MENNKNTETKFCVNCGKTIPKEAIFCPFCGAKQPEISSNSETYERPTEVFIPSKKEKNPDMNLNKSPVGSTKTPWFKKWWAWCIAAIAAIGIGIGIYNANYDSLGGVETSTTDSSSTDDDTSDGTDTTTDDSSSDATDDETGDFTNEAVAGISSSDYDSTEAANNTATYGELIKSDDHAGESYNIDNGEVLQADESDGATTLLVYTSDYDDIIKVYYADTTKAVEDDYVNVKGVLGKREDYDTQSGGTNTVPTIVAQSITVTGSDTE